MSTEVDIRKTVLEQIKSSVAEYEPDVRGAKELASQIIVTSVETAESASDLALSSKRLSDKLETLRKAIKEPYLDAGKSIDAEFKRLTQPLDAIVSDLKRKIVSYQTAERARLQAEADKIRRENEERALAEAQRLEESGRSDLATVAMDVAAETMQQTVVAPVAISGGMSKVVTSMHWTYRVKDMRDVPNNYLTLDERAVKAAISQGTRFIAGLEIYQEERSSIR